MEINLNPTCPECGDSCTVAVKKKSRTVRIECDTCGITDHIPEYSERVVLS